MSVPSAGTAGKYFGEACWAALSSELRMITSVLTGQLILGTDKRNPLFTVYADEDQEQLHVYYGLELLEVVSADRNDPSFKMLVGRLHNAGLSLRVLQSTFQADPKTIQRWGRALRSRDARELIRLLAGRRAGRKLTLEIEAYVRARWADLSRQGTYGISGRLRREIESVFRVKLSRETLRRLVGKLKRGEGLEVSAQTTAEGLLQTNQKATDGQQLSSEEKETACDCATAGPAELPEPSTSGASSARPLESDPQTLWCDHAGVLLFAPMLLATAQVLDPPEALFKQWLASLLLGALNIEQTKFLNWEDLSRLLGSVVRFPHPQRQELERVASEANCQALARFNARQIAAEKQSDFYFDPHTKHYTGGQNVLEGWCPVIRWADKAMHSDFIHTAEGQPLYFETTDNFADLRERFFAVVERCRKVLEWPAERVLSWVVDRAIFGKEVFEKVLANPALHLITWEKGYEAQSWPPAGGLSGSMVIERARNRAEDIRSYHLEYWDRAWPNDQRLRQLVVQATNPKGQTIQVSVLTDDLKRAAVEILRLIFCRWVQENDFKYLDKHFGINQITSYGVIGYEELRAHVEDRQVRSAESKALQEQRRQLRGQQGRLLLLQAKTEHQSAERQKRIEQLESAPAAEVANQELGRLRQGQTRSENIRHKRQEQIEQLSQELAAVEQKAQTVQKTESRLERLIEEKMVRLEPNKKRLMDCLRVLARNVFYAALAPFKKAYNNYRDDHDQFRQLTQASGVLEVRAEQIVVHLLPRVNYSPQLRRIIGQRLEQINEQQPALPDGSARRLKFRLANRTEMKLSMESSS
jgi:hypothetical protein